MYQGYRICGVKKERRRSLPLTRHRMLSGAISCLLGAAESKSGKTVQVELSIRLWVAWSRKFSEVAGGKEKHRFSPCKRMG